jgi:hypothetical protein
MEEITKKAKAPAKPRKTAAKKTAVSNVTEMPHSTANGAAPSNAVTPSGVTEIGISREQVALLAHKYWAERGHQHGHHVDDWLRAEQELRGKAS